MSNLGTFSNLPKDVRTTLYSWCPAKYAVLSKDFLTEVNPLQWWDTYPSFWELQLVAQKIEEIAEKNAYNSQKILAAMFDCLPISIATLGYIVTDLCNIGKNRFVLKVGLEEKRVWVDCASEDMSYCIRVGFLLQHLRGTRGNVHIHSHMLYSILSNRHNDRQRTNRTGSRINRAVFDREYSMSKLPFGVDELIAVVGFKLDGFIVTKEPPSDELVERARQLIVREEKLEKMAEVVLLELHSYYRSFEHVYDVIQRLGLLDPSFGDKTLVQYAQQSKQIPKTLTGMRDLLSLLHCMQLDLFGKIKKQVFVEEVGEFGEVVFVPIVDWNGVVSNDRWFDSYFENGHPSAENSP